MKQAAVTLRLALPDSSYDDVRKFLCRQFGVEEGAVSDRSLRRIWRRAGLQAPREGRRLFERVQHLMGGGALALLGAAAEEFGGFTQLAAAAQSAGRSVALKQGEVVERKEDLYRDERGRFTKAYNEAWREEVQPNQADARWLPDRAKADVTPLGSLSVLGFSVETLGHRLFALGLAGMITDERGFDGLKGPRARWAVAAGIHDYRPATLDKTLAELALLGLNDVLWREYARVWSEKVAAWSAGGPRWSQVVKYIDITYDPYWTRRYSKSGKVSRVGRVMPCLSRVVIMGGCGFPLLMDTQAGTTPLRSVILGALSSTDHLTGAGDMAHLTIVDAEAASLELLTLLNDLPGHVFVTVLKGRSSQGVTLLDPGEWQRYRERDTIRAGRILIQDQLPLFAVEMRREDSRNPHVTTFITSAPPETLSPFEVCDAYLSRWPNQEGRFRDYRNGPGLDRSHGYGGENVLHAALTDKMKASERAVARAGEAVEEAQQRQSTLQELCQALPATSKQELKGLLNATKKEARLANKRLASAREAKRRLESTPTTIFERDTTRENIATVATLCVTMLVEWVLREYMGGAKMELRTFLSLFMYLPTTIETSGYRLAYTVDVRDLPAREAEMVRTACEEITRRRIKRDERMLVFGVAPDMVEVDRPPR